MLGRSLSCFSLAALTIAAGCSGRTIVDGDAGDDGGATDSAAREGGSGLDGATAIDASIDGSSVEGGGIDSGRDASRDSGRDSSFDGGVCSPADVSGFQPPAYRVANRQQGICTTFQIGDFYQACLAPNATMQTCAPYGSTGTSANKACAACIISPSTASSYGAIVENAGTVSLNIAGCMELKDSNGGLACARAYQASEKCDEAACAANCPVTDDASFQLYQACVQQAAANGCMTYATAARCADAEADGGAAAVCFQGQTFQDLYLNVVPVFCGP